MIVIPTLEELPANCEECPCFYRDGGLTECNLTKRDVGYYNSLNPYCKDKRPDDCPLIKI